MEIKLKVEGSKLYIFRVEHQTFDDNRTTEMFLRLSSIDGCALIEDKYEAEYAVILYVCGRDITLFTCENADEAKNVFEGIRDIIDENKLEYSYGG